MAVRFRKPDELSINSGNILQINVQGNINNKYNSYMQRL